MADGARTLFLNLGCGNRFHSDWTNVDFVATAPGVIAHDLTTGVPAADGSVSVVYHSHVLEHFSREGGRSFVAECFRVLAPGGTLRFAIPDLEGIARAYLKTIDEYDAGDATALERHDWMVLELYDQTVRTRSGGEMAAVLAKDDVPQEVFIRSRLGEEAVSIRSALRRSQQDKATPRDQSASIRWAKRMLRPSAWRTLAERVILGKDRQLLQDARFRASGEIHMHMYDRLSAIALMQKVGFVDCKVVSATESRIEHWTRFDLDTNPDGSVYEPDSLFVEGTRP